MSATARKLVQLTDDALVALARSTASSRRPSRTDPIRWRQALAEAPWDPSLPDEQEQAFRRAYAAELVGRGMALAAGAPTPGRASGPRGEGGRRVTVDMGRGDRYEQIEAAAAAESVTVSEWIKAACDEKISRSKRAKKG